MSVYEATDQFFRDHYIAEDVRNARNYVRWTVHKPELGRKPFEDECASLKWPRLEG